MVNTVSIYKSTIMSQAQVAVKKSYHKLTNKAKISRLKDAVNSLVVMATATATGPIILDHNEGGVVTEHKISRTHVIRLHNKIITQLDSMEAHARERTGKSSKRFTMPQVIDDEAIEFVKNQAGAAGGNQNLLRRVWDNTSSGYALMFVQSLTTFLSNWLYNSGGYNQITKQYHVTPTFVNGLRNGITKAINLGATKAKEKNRQDEEFIDNLVAQYMAYLNNPSENQVLESYSYKSGKNNSKIFNPSTFNRAQIASLSSREVVPSWDDKQKGEWFDYVNAINQQPLSPQEQADLQGVIDRGLVDGDTANKASPIQKRGLIVKAAVGKSIVPSKPKK